MRMWPLAVILTLAACVGSTKDLPPALAPTTPLLTQPGADVLAPVGPTTFTGTPGASTVVQVKATMSNGRPVNAVTVVFKVQAGSGSVQPVVTMTDGNGIASTTWTFGGAPAVNLMSATGGFTDSPVTFTASTISASGSRAP